MGKKAFPAHGIPVAPAHLSAEHGGAHLHSVCHGFQLVVSLLNACVEAVGFGFFSNEQPYHLYPFCLSQWGQFLIPQVGHQGDARIFEGVITATLEGRDKDEVGIDRQDHFVVKVALNTYLVCFPLFQLLV